MDTTNVFSRNLDAYLTHKGTQAIIANQGGQGSSKTISILQLLYLIALHSSVKLRITIGSYALPHLRAGALQDFEDILIREDISPESVRNKSEFKYFIGRSELSFVGIEGNEAKATGPRRDILYINEANKRIDYKVFELMNARTRLATFIDFNPSAEFWFHEKIVPNFEHVLIKSTFLDNEYLPERERNNLLAKKGKPGFENWWKVYGEGELGQLEGAVFTNWRFGEFDETLRKVRGLDFGVTDPDAMVKVAIDKKEKKIYLKEEIYQGGNSTDALADSIRSCTDSNDLIIADSQASRTIKDLQKQKINVVACIKNRVNEDIKIIKGYELIIDPLSYNLHKELNNYIWLDKKSETPIDAFNHLLDAARYGIMYFLKPNVKKGMKAL